jgi:hypothetical protein
MRLKRIDLHIGTARRNLERDQPHMRPPVDKHAIRWEAPHHILDRGRVVATKQIRLRFGPLIEIEIELGSPDLTSSSQASTRKPAPIDEGGNANVTRSERNQTRDGHHPAKESNFPRAAPFSSLRSAGRDHLSHPWGATDGLVSLVRATAPFDGDGKGSMAEQDSAATGDEAAREADVQPKSRLLYERPRITVLGTLAELTGGPASDVETDFLMTGSQ